MPDAETPVRRYGLMDRLDSLVHRRLMPVRFYPSWEAAARASGEAGYNDGTLNAFRVGRRHRVAPGAGHPALASVLFDGCRVTDFGGAIGEVGDALLASSGGLDFTVVENPVLVELMRHQDTRVRFVSDVPGECDVFFSSGTLQYLASPYEVLQRGFASARRHVVLVRNNFAPVERFTVHRSRLYDNGSGPLPPGFRNLVVRYPMRTILQDRIEAIAAAAGFVLELQRPDPEFTYKGGHSSDLVFRRS